MVYGIIVGLPCLAFILSLIFRYCCGPFWLGYNSDPAYLYFMNSLYLADHKMPTFIQHPGTPLQILGAVVIKILSFPAHGQAMVEEALKRPEYFLSGIYAVELLFYITTLIILGWYAYRHTKDWIFVLLVQSPLFLYLTMYKDQSSMLPVVANVCAESLLIGVLNIYALCLLRTYFTEKARSFIITAASWGIVGGLMMATKVICLPLLLMPLVVLPSFKARGIFAAAVVLSFITATMPIWPEYPLIFNWLALLMSHTDYIGNGSAGFIAWPVYLSAIITVFKWQWVLMTGSLFALGFIAWRSLIGPKDGAKARWFAAWTIGTVFLQFLMVGKEPQDHYMIPAMGLWGVLWAFVYQGSLKKFWIWRGALVFFVLISTIFSVIYMRNFYVSSRVMLDFSKEIYSRFDQCIICGYYRSSSQAFAVEFGDDNAGRKAYGDIIQKIYPQHYFMGVLEKRFDDSKHIVYGEDLLAQSPCVLLYGMASEFNHYSSPLLSIQLIDQRGHEALYRVLAARDKEAMQLFYMAQMALMQGQAQIAYTLGLRAQALGLPAAHDLIARMDDVIAKGRTQ